MSARSLTALALAALGACVLLFSATPALAGTVTDERPFLFEFDGSDTTAGRFTQPEGIAFHYSTGTVYLLNTAGTGRGTGPEQDPSNRVIDKFDAQGQAQNFSALGASSLDGSATPGGAFGVDGFFGTGSVHTDIAVDNSAVNPGRIYVAEAAGPVHAFDPDGTYLWTLPSSSAGACGIAVGPDGHPWVIDAVTGGTSRAIEFAATGSPPAEIGSFPITSPPGRSPCHPAIDQTHTDLYLADGGTADFVPVKYVNGSFDSILTEDFARRITLDQSSPTGHVFTAHSNFFREFDSSDAQVGSFGAQVLGQAGGIAYNPALDRVYVSNLGDNTVKVFGPITSGLVPDITIAPATDVTRTEATAHGTMNPQGLANTYRFQWKQGTGPVWGAAQSSLPQSLPADSSDHPVSFPITGLNQNTTYQVRVVATNTDNSLAAYSAPDTFTTLAPPPPTVSIDQVSPITTDSAHLDATIDPQEDTTTWRVQKSTDPTCAGGFVNEPLQTIPTPGPGPVSVDWDLTGLEPAQTYCLRLTATNSGGTGTDDQVIQTLVIAPTDADTAFAAPRTDTAARINARVNPQGEADFTYRFEWSTDGEDWTPLPDRVFTAEAREPVVVADELTGLTPNTTYRYRLGLLENHGAEGSGGPAESLGEERTFTTRTSGEIEALDPPSCPNDAVRAAQRTAYLASCRAVELVNNPDKGNQNVFTDGPVTVRDASPMTQDGNRVLWFTFGGAPGGPNGTRPSFLAERTPAGWRSHSAAPPAEEQVGGGDFLYKLNGAPPDFGAFIFGVRGSTGFALPPPPTIVRVRDGVQDILKATTVQVPNPIYETSVNLSDDGEHVLFIDSMTKQLEDVGAARVGPPEVPGEVVSLLPPPGSPLGVPAPGGSESECGLDFENGFSFGSTVSALIHPGYHWIATADASRVYFRVQPDPPEPLEEGEECTSPYALYVRNRDDGMTTPIDYAAPEFIRATPDGRAAYLRTTSKLAPADTNSGADLYRWDETAGESSCLTCVVPDAQVSSDGVLVSEDFSHLYFLSQEQLIEGQGKAGGNNLYALSGGELRFVATVDRFVLNDARLSTDGNVLLFGERAGPQLTADQIAAGTTQLYRYDDRDASLECLSCERQGVTTESFGTSLGGVSQFVLSGDGTTAAFATPQALTPRDVNNDTDIYEWRAGAQLLISDGVTDFQTEFAAPRVAAIDEDGSNVLFALVPPGGSLTGFERDSVMNLYDARIGGGFAPPAPPVHCVEDSCQGPLVAPPPLPAGGGRFQGRGNVSEPPNCGRLAHRAQRLSRHARRLSRAARHTHSGRRSRNLRRRANHLAKRAKRLSRSAKRCRKQARVNGRAQR